MEKGNGKIKEEAVIDFSTFMYSIGTAAMISLGLVPNPVNSQKECNLAEAKQNIHILEMLQEKTKGNLSSEEDRLLSSILHEVRTKFVECSKDSTIKL